MNRTLCFAVSSVLLCVTTTTAQPDTANESMLLTTNQVERMLDDIDLRIIDTRSASDYRSGHIPGAIQVDVSAWKSLASTKNGFRDSAGWTRAVGAVGISNESHVVVYGNNLSGTARIWWLLKYVGVKNASILDGGWDRWKREGKRISTSIPSVASTSFEPNFQVDRLSEIDSVKQSLKDDSVSFVDTRSDREFNSGRIPKSKHLEWTELVAVDGRLKTKAQLEELFLSKGIVPANTAVCY